jgi:alcohol dehydrogenase
MADPSAAFDHQPRTRVVCGAGVVDRVGELAGQLGATRALIVTDPGVSAAGHLDQVRRAIEGAGLTTAVFDQVRENPTTLDVDRCVESARGMEFDLIIGLGGGSSLDTAKGCNFLLTNGGKMTDYRGSGRALKPMLTMIAVPTTAGTGSECQSYALIADEDTHQKMACGDPKAAPAVALLDPRLTLTQPRRVTAVTGIDAISHGIESYVTNVGNAISRMHARESLRLTLPGLPRVLGDEADLDLRADMLLGASLGGLAIENSMLGGAHAAANPLTANYGITHGHAVGIMLPHVIRFNAQHAQTLRAYDQLLADAVGGERRGEDAGEYLASRVEDLLNTAQLAATLSDCGVEKSSLPTLAQQAAEQWTARFNPVPVGIEDFARLYESAFDRGA